MVLVEVEVAEADDFCEGVVAAELRGCGVALCEDEEAGERCAGS